MRQYPRVIRGFEMNRTLAQFGLRDFVRAADAKLFEFLLNCVGESIFGVNPGRVVALEFEGRADHFPTAVAAVDFKTVLDELAAFFAGTHHGNKDPLIMVEPLEGFDFAVRNGDGLGMIIDGLNPRLLAHGLASVIEKEA
jgi:hypothetical protein